MLFHWMILFFSQSINDQPVNSNGPEAPNMEGLNNNLEEEMIMHIVDRNDQLSNYGGMDDFNGSNDWVVETLMQQGSSNSVSQTFVSNESSC